MDVTLDVSHIYETPWENKLKLYPETKIDQSIQQFKNEQTEYKLKVLDANYTINKLKAEFTSLTNIKSGISMYEIYKIVCRAYSFKGYKVNNKQIDEKFIWQDIYDTNKKELNYKLKNSPIILKIIQTQINDFLENIDLLAGSSNDVFKIGGGGIFSNKTVDYVPTFKDLVFDKKKVDINDGKVTKNIKSISYRISTSNRHHKTFSFFLGAGIDQQERIKKADTWNNRPWKGGSHTYNFGGVTKGIHLTFILDTSFITTNKNDKFFVGGGIFGQLKQLRNQLFKVGNDKYMATIKIPYGKKYETIYYNYYKNPSTDNSYLTSEKINTTDGLRELEITSTKGYEAGKNVRINDYFGSTKHPKDENGDPDTTNLGKIYKKLKFSLDVSSSENKNDNDTYHIGGGYFGNADAFKLTKKNDNIYESGEIKVPYEFNFDNYKLEYAYYRNLTGPLDFIKKEKIVNKNTISIKVNEWGDRKLTINKTGNFDFVIKDYWNNDKKLNVEDKYLIDYQLFWAHEDYGSGHKDELDVLNREENMDINDYPAFSIKPYTFKYHTDDTKHFLKPARMSPQTKNFEYNEELCLFIRFINRGLLRFDKQQKKYIPIKNQNLPDEDSIPIKITINKAFENSKFFQNKTEGNLNEEYIKTSLLDHEWGHLVNNDPNDQHYIETMRASSDKTNRYYILLTWEIPTEYNKYYKNLNFLLNRKYTIDITSSDDNYIFRCPYKLNAWDTKPKEYNPSDNINFFKNKFLIYFPHAPNFFRINIKKKINQNQYYSPNDEDEKETYNIKQKEDKYEINLEFSMPSNKFNKSIKAKLTFPENDYLDFENTLDVENNMKIVKTFTLKDNVNLQKLFKEENGIIELKLPTVVQRKDTTLKNGDKEYEGKNQVYNKGLNATDEFEFCNYYYNNYDKNKSPLETINLKILPVELNFLKEEQWLNLESNFYKETNWSNNKNLRVYFLQKPSPIEYKFTLISPSGVNNKEIEVIKDFSNTDSIGEISKEINGRNLTIYYFETKQILKINVGLYEIQEDEPIGTTVGLITVEDILDRNLTVTLDGDDSFKLVNNNTIITEKKLDFEIQTSHKLKINVKEGDKILINGEVIINVGNVPNTDIYYKSPFFVSIYSSQYGNRPMNF